MVQSPQEIKKYIEELIPDEFELQAMFFYSIFDKFIHLHRNSIKRYFILLRIDNLLEREVMFQILSEYVEIIHWVYLDEGIYNIEISKLEEKE